MRSKPRGRSRRGEWYAVAVLAALCGVISGCGGSGLSGKTPDERALSAGRLGVTGADQNVAILADAFPDEPEPVQAQIVQSLGRIGTAGAVAALEQASQHESRLIRVAVAQAYQDVQPQNYAAACRVLVEMGRRALPVTPSNDPNRDERQAIVTSLAVVKQECGLDFLIERLDADIDQNIREASARTLGRLQQPRAVQPLVVAYGRDNERIRALAIEALGLIGAPEGAPTVEAALRDLDPVTRGKAGWSLMQLRGKEAIPALQTMLAAETNDIAAVHTAHALALLGDGSAVALLEDRILHARDEMARAEAGKALAEVGRRESFAIVDRAFEEDRDGLVKREAGLAARALLKKFPDLAPPAGAAENSAGQSEAGQNQQKPADGAAPAAPSGT